MSKSDDQKQAAFLKRRERLAEKTIRNARNSLAVGNDKWHLLTQVNPFYLAEKSGQLVGILEADPRESNALGYHCVQAGELDISLVFLETGDKAKRYFRYHEQSGTPLDDLFDAYRDTHPVSLYFMGCDDGHFAKGFASEEEALTYLNDHPHFNRLVEAHTVSLKDLNYLLTCYPMEEVLTMMDTYLFIIN